MSSACGAVLARRYRLEQRIAIGGYGEVWRGTDVMLGRPVAVKLLLTGHAQDPQTLARFRAEALHAAALAHENIARVYDYAEADPPYLVMEFVDGPSLAAVMTSGPMDPAKAMDIVAQTASGLHAAHRAGLIHRDVKPGNLLLSRGSVVKITDFGISYVAGSTPVTTAGQLMGTPGYIAPERTNGIPASPASDLYSLGVVAYECLMGAAPFAGVALEVALAHRDRPMPALPASVPADAAALVGELTAKDPGRRPGSAGEVAQRAERIRDGLGGGATAEAPGREPAGSPVRTLRAEAIGAGAGLPSQGPPSEGPPSEGPPSQGPPPPGAGRRFGWPAWVAAGVIVAAAVLGLVLASVLGPGPPPGHPAATTPSAPSSQRSATVTTVRVNAGSLIGQPVDLVVSRLRQLGLEPRVLWRASARQAPGRVLAVQPGGQVATGSPVTVLAAMRPQPSSPAQRSQPGPPARRPQPSSPAQGKPHPGKGDGKGGHHGGDSQQ
ncbi:MAG TPA: protein kinase [Streptosporangiaceae bacterium]|jgi:serine/threonine-protein kinase